MVDEESLSIQDALDRVSTDVDPKLRLEVVAHPEIVIPHQVGDAHTRVTQCCKGAKKSDMPFGHDCPVFKPIVEQISDDEDVLGSPAHLFQEPDNAVLALPVVLGDPKPRCASEKKMIGRRIAVVVFLAGHCLSRSQKNGPKSKDWRLLGVGEAGRKHALG